MTGRVTAAYLREQRDRPSVLKTRLSTLRAKFPCKLVIVLEGDDDLPVYEVWIDRVLPGLKWEPMPANGKRNALAFFDVLERDTTGLKVCTYFTVDHDYDGFGGRGPAENVYVLPAYSIENYLVGEDVLESILRTDFRVVGEDVEERDTVLTRYAELRQQFVDAIEDVCATLCGARNHPVGNVSVRESVMACFDTTLAGLSVKDQEALKNLVVSERPVPEEAVARGREFILANPLLWIRGKYLYAFFKAFVANVFDDRRSPAPTLFSESVPSLAGVAAAFDLGRLASRCSVPPGLLEHLARWSEECARECEQEEAA